MRLVDLPTVPAQPERVPEQGGEQQLFQILAGSSPPPTILVPNSLALLAYKGAIKTPVLIGYMAKRFPKFFPYTRTPSPTRPKERKDYFDPLTEKCKSTKP